MVSIDQIEVLLRTLPQYMLFASLSLFIFAWIERKPKLSAIAEIVLLITGLLAIITLLSGIIPSPLAEGVVKEHIEMVIKMLTLFSINGLLALCSLLIRLINKKMFKPLVFITFALAIFIFFTSTKLSKIKFELNVPAQTEQSMP